MTTRSMEGDVAAVEPSEIRHEISLYRQRRDYTCGPSSVMMVMSSLDPEFSPNEVTELEIWREATTIHGGCGPIGLALALKRRGFASHAMLSHDGIFLESRASAEVEKQAMQILQRRDLEEATKKAIDIAYGDFSNRDLGHWMVQGWYPIVMLSIEFQGRTITHWVVVSGVDRNNLTIRDPLTEQNAGEEATLLEIATFERMSRFGPAKERAVVLAGPSSMISKVSPFGRSPVATS